MNRHRINLTGIALFIFLPGLLTAADPLWDRVMNHTAPENTDQALAMNMVSNQKNRDGEITKTTEMVFTWDTGTEDFLLVSAMENGKDVTDRERRRAERRDDDDRGNYAHQMFNPGKSDGLSLDPRDISAIINGRECRIYDFRFEDEWPMGPGKPKPVVEVGVLFVDQESGMPLRLTSSIAEGPNAVKYFGYTMEAGPGPSGLWRVDEVKMEFVGQMIVYMAGGFTMNFDYGD
jgi:hypothetical protein